MSDRKLIAPVVATLMYGWVAYAQGIECTPTLVHDALPTLVIVPEDGLVLVAESGVLTFDRSTTVAVDVKTTVQICEADALTKDFELRMDDLSGNETVLDEYHVPFGVYNVAVPLGNGHVIAPGSYVYRLYAMINGTNGQT